jgi:ATPase subunit of ABC transporter with duplicated ATPase domains
VIKPINKLSGGEISKVRFAKLSLEDSNLLILDEPTNHLDKIAKESLFESIENYPGTVILVSHEKEFYKKLKMKEIHFS